MDKSNSLSANEQYEKTKNENLKKFKQDSESRRQLPKNERKSLTKAAGLKSTIAFASDTGKTSLIFTSFGRGNDAVIEKKFSDGDLQNICGTGTFSLTKINEGNIGFTVQSHRISELKTQADNPLHRKSENYTNQNTIVRSDMLLLKDTFEKRFFGKTFNDTLHIQTIYNILDIDKILTEYSVNTVYALNNLFGDENPERFDLIGTLTYQNTYEDFKNTNDYSRFKQFYSLNSLGYYGHVLFKNKKKRSEKDVYIILSLLATIRQWCVHCEEDKRTWIFNAEKVLDREYLDILDDVYLSTIKRVNNNFISNNKVNIIILSKILSINGDDKLTELIRRYYKFIVTKEQKQLGFSLKKIREFMLENTNLKNTTYDSVRSKLYKLIDFLMYYKYSTDEFEIKNASSLVEKLRLCLSDEAKESVYMDESKRLWPVFESIIENNIIPFMKPDTIKLYNKEKTLDHIDINDIITGESLNSSYFSKIIFLLCQFLDGKEVNDLTTTLVSKFDNIRSFIDVAHQLNIDIDFVPEYSLFKTSDSVRNELSLIKNLVGMKYYDITVKHQMYHDAIDILGIRNDMSDAEIDEYIDKKILILGNNGKPIPKTQRNFRNFLISNVIESDRFRYIVKYANPKKIRKIACNKKIIKFVLGRITETQIERYYRSCYPELSNAAYPGTEAAIDKLTTIIFDMRFDNFKNVNQRARNNTPQAKEKMMYQAIISLYLTVCYHFVKNLVNINARYVIAFHMLERDARLYKIFSSEEDYRNNLGSDYSVLTRNLLSDSPEKAGTLYLRNPKWNNLIRNDLDNYSSEASRLFRNAVAHLNPIRNADAFLDNIAYVDSYYSVYHYIFQRSILNNLRNNTEKTNEYRENVNKFKSYSKDFVKALCVPFGYNIVRFKSLSIYEMFDRNYHCNTKSDKSDDTSLISE